MKYYNTYRTLNILIQMAKNINGERIIKCKHSYEAGVKDDLITTATNFLQNNQVIAVPTDTIYGLAARAQNVDAVLKLYELKKRDLVKPVAICVANISDIPRWAKVTIPDQLLSMLLPGPVTLVFERTAELNPHLNLGVPLVGIRIPNHDLIRRIVEVFGEPIALTSANLSETRSSLEISEFESFWPQLPLVIDGGKLGDTDEARFGSTVIDFSKRGCFRVIREGSAFESTKKKLLQFNLVELINDFVS